MKSSLFVGLAVAAWVLGVAAGPAHAQFCDTEQTTNGCAVLNLNNGNFSNPAPCVGVGAPQLIIGTEGADVIDGRGGIDVILGLGGNDRLCGGGNSDVIDGGAGSDRIFGQGNTDFLLDSGGGNDTFDGGAGADICLDTAPNPGNNKIISCSIF